MTGGGIAAYITSHGFGHLNRAAAVLERLPASIPLTIVGDDDLLPHWHERLTRPFAWRTGRFDAGAVNPVGASHVTDAEATLRQAWDVHQASLGRIDSEAEWLRHQGLAAVLADAPAPPLVAARRADIDGYLLANFTWADIYAPMVAQTGDSRGAELVAALIDQYRQAALTFRMEPGLTMNWLDRKQDVGLVVRPGRDRGAELRRVLGLPASDLLASFYAGRCGQDDLEIEGIARLEQMGVHLVMLGIGATRRLPNRLHVVPAEAWGGGELVASCDLVIAKAGYGTVSAAMISRRPMIYPPRAGFIEHEALDAALRRWDGGHPVSAEAFRTFDLEEVIARARARRPGPCPFATDGAEQVADRLIAAATR